MHFVLINKHRDEFLGGSELQCDLIARTLLEKGHRVTYLAVSGTRSVYQTAYEVRNLDGELRGLSDALSELEPHVVYWRHNKRGLLRSVITCKKLGIPFVFACASENDVLVFASTIPDDSPIRFRRLKQLYQKARSAYDYGAHFLVDGAIAQNTAQYAALRASNKIQIRNSYIDQCESFEWRRPFIVWVGTVKQSKKPELFVELASRCSDLPVDFLMIGPLADPSCEGIREDSRTSDNFHYLGERPYAEANGIIAASEFLVHTSVSEGFSNVLIQAWMNAKPTLTISIDPDDLISTNEIGNRCDTFGGLVSRTRKLISEPSLTNELGRNARKIAEPLFDVEDNVDALIEFCRGVA